MNKLFLLLLTTMMLLALTSMTGCFDAIRASGNVEPREYDFTGFNQIQIASAFEFEIRQAEAYTITIKADDNLHEYTSVKSENEILSIGMERVSITGPATLEVIITMPDLNSLKVSGASNGTLTGFSSNNKLDIAVSGACLIELEDITCGRAKFDISGASKATGNLNSENIKFNISGASLVDLTGTGQDIEARLSGASKLDLENFIAVNADVNIDGASNGTLNLNGLLNADIQGASRLQYYGQPEMGNISTGIASKIISKNEKP